MTPAEPTPEDFGFVDSGCPHDPQETGGPIGMYPCPDCGCMVLASMPHTLCDDSVCWRLNP